ncbi:hypothetical protein L1283_002207, partial [Sphingobacterium sp. HSC-15S19]
AFLIAKNAAPLVPFLLHSKLPKVVYSDLPITIVDPRIFFGIKTDLIRTYLGFIDLLLQSEKSTEILPIIEQALPLTEKEKNRIKQIVTLAASPENASSKPKK